MSKHKCQVCDGPIVNGRCSWCGMPYRNDEILYHLNESRSDHYRHATVKAREELRESQIPLGDKMPEQKNVRERGNKAQPRNSISGKKAVSGSRVAGRPEYAAGPNKYKTPTVGEYTARSSRQSAGMGGTLEKKKASHNKKSGSGIVIVVIIVICTLLPAFIEYVKDNYSYELSSLFNKDIDTEDLQAFFVLDRSAGEVVVGDWFPEGEYVLEIDGGYAALLLQHGGSTKRYNLSDDESQVSVTLRHGDTISLRNVDMEERFVTLYLMKES